jgi:hypothetical protein
MTLESAVLTRFPRQATREDYVEAAEELEGLLRGLPGIVAIYRTGGVAAPGISDLDRVVVVEGGRHVPAIWSKLSPQTRYLSMHSPFLVDAQTFSRHRWIADLQPLEVAWGEAQKVEERPEQEYSGRLIAAEALVVTALKLMKQASTGRVKVRPLLCELNNVGRDLFLARLPQEAAPDAWALAEKVTRLREGWWSDSPPERLSRLEEVLGRSQAALFEALRALAATVGCNGSTKPLRLAAGWGNVTLVPGDRARPNEVFLSRLTRHSRRLAEARWRWIRHEVATPPGIISLLAGNTDRRFDGFRAGRNELARRYRIFVRANPGYSGIGLAAVFIP